MNKTCIRINGCVIVFFVGLLVCAQWRHERRESTTPVPISTGEDPADATQRLTLIFTGDLMQHLPQVLAATDQSGTIDYTACFSAMKPYFESADYVITNLETTLGEAPYSGFPRFCSPRTLAWNMRQSGIDIAVMANNHVCDQGSRGILSTIQALSRAGVPHTGAFVDSADYAACHPLVLRKNGFRVALLNYTYGTNGLPVPADRLVNLIDTVRIIRDMERVKKTDATHMILFFHWGNEYETRPNDSQQALAAMCHRRGADLVIGSHPHVVQPVETVVDAQGHVRGVTVFSLGNFISNQRQPHTDGGISVRITLSNRDGEPTEYLPEYLIHWTYIATDGGSRSGKRYVVVPAPCGDMVDAASRPVFERYVETTRAHIGKYGSGFREIQNLEK